MISLSKTLVLVAATITAVGAVPQPGPPHQNCDQAVATLANDADANKCLAISQLSQIFANPDASVVSAVNNWLTAMCSAQPCMDSTVTGVLTASIQGCSEEASWFAVPKGQSVDAASVSQKYYPAFRKALCLKEGNDLCATQTLTSYEKTVGTLTLAKFQQFIESDTSSLPSGVICTNCNKAVHNVYRQFLGSDSTEPSQSKQLCGDAFVDGKNPPGISGV